MKDECLQESDSSFIIQHSSFILSLMSRRLLKAAEAIRGVVSMAILTELRDPRVKNVTVVGVEVLPDMRAIRDTYAEYLRP